MYLVSEHIKRYIWREYVSRTASQPHYIRHILPVPPMPSPESRYSTTQCIYRAYPVHNCLFSLHLIPSIPNTASESPAASAHSIASHKSSALFVYEELDMGQVRYTTDPFRCKAAYRTQAMRGTGLDHMLQCKCTIEALTLSNPSNQCLSVCAPADRWRV